MTRRIRLRPEAVRDVERAVAWYDDQQVEGLSRRFISALDTVFERIQSHPHLHAKVHRDLRVTMTGKFPYLVCYLVHDNEIEIVAVMHAHKDPDEWIRRG